MLIMCNHINLHKNEIWHWEHFNPTHYHRYWIKLDPRPVLEEHQKRHLKYWKSCRHGRHIGTQQPDNLKTNQQLVSTSRKWLVCQSPPGTNRTTPLSWLAYNSKCDWSPSNFCHPTKKNNWRAHMSTWALFWGGHVTWFHRTEEEFHLLFNMKQK